MTNTAKYTAPGGKAIALAGQGQQEDRQRTRGAGVDVRRVTPVDFVALDSLLKQLRPAGEPRS